MENDENKQPQLIGLSGTYKDNEYLLNKEEFIIGRASICDLMMKESTISAKHAKITRTNDEFEIIDLDSTNGTFVNGIKVDKKRLRTADKIKLDVFEFTFFNPQDAVRTILSSPSEPGEIKETVVRPQAEDPEDREALSLEKTHPIPIVESKTTQGLKKGGSFFPGLMIGILIAFIVAYGGIFLGTLIQFNFSTSNIFNILRSQIIIFPLLHLHNTWINTSHWTIQVIIIAISLPVGLLLGGLISQSIGRKNRLITASSFAFFYVLLAIVAQLIALNFNIDNWLDLVMSSGLGFSSEVLNLVALVVYFWGIGFIFSYIGTLIGRK